MAVEYSLLTWAGLGTTVTFTDAGDIVNFTAHGAPNGHAFRFTTTGALPTGLTAGTTYYLRQGADANKFVIHPTQADATAGTNQVTFTGTGSGTNKVVGEYWSALDTAGRARYGSAGSERVYGTMGSWVTYINTPANQNWDKDIGLEIWDKYTDVTQFYGATGYKSIHIESKVNGVRTPAFHWGFPGSGYRISRTGSSQYCFYVIQQDVLIDGVEAITDGLSNSYGFLGTGTAASFKSINNISSAWAGYQTLGVGSLVLNCIAVNCASYGFDPAGGPNVYAFNHASGCAVGFSGAYALSYQHQKGLFIGNVSVGNTINWGVKNGTLTSASFFVCKNNCGDSTDIKTVTFENSATPGTLTCRLSGHTFTVNTPIRFKNGGSATAPGNIAFSTLYYIKTVATDTFTLATTVGGTAIAYSSSGSGTITTSLVWDTSDTVGYVSTSDFIDYANKNFKPALLTSPQVELIALATGDGLPRYDIADAVRPNYKASAYPNNKATAGPFEYDHAEGLAPTPAILTLSGLQPGSDVVILAAGTSTIIQSADQVAGTTYDYTYSSSVAVDIGVIKPGRVTKYVRNFTLPSFSSVLPITQDVDRTYI